MPSKICHCARALTHWILTVETWVQTQSRPCWISDLQSGTRTGISPSTSVLFHQWLFFSVLSHPSIHHRLPQ